MYKLTNKGKRVIVTGLDMDFRGKTFGPMPNLMAAAEFVRELHAFCNQTGGMANYTNRKLKIKEKLKLEMIMNMKHLAGNLFLVKN